MGVPCRLSSWLQICEVFRVRAGSSSRSWRVKAAKQAFQLAANLRETIPFAAKFESLAIHFGQANAMAASWLAQAKFDWVEMHTRSFTSVGRRMSHLCFDLVEVRHILERPLGFMLDSVGQISVQLVNEVLYRKCKQQYDVQDAVKKAGLEVFS